MNDPTPEELAIIQKFCKHSMVIPEKSIEFLKVGESQKFTCDRSLTTEAHLSVFCV